MLDDFLKEIKEESRVRYNTIFSTSIEDLWLRVEQQTWEDYRLEHIQALSEKALYMQREEILAFVHQKLQPRPLPFEFIFTKNKIKKHCSYMQEKMQSVGYTLEDRIYIDFIACFLTGLCDVQDRLKYLGFEGIEKIKGTIHDYSQYFQYVPSAVLGCFGNTKKPTGIVEFMKTNNIKTNVIRYSENCGPESILQQAIYQEFDAEIIVELLNMKAPYMKGYLLLENKRSIIAACKRQMSQDRDWNETDIDRFTIMAEKLVMGEHIPISAHRKKFKI